MIKKFIKIFIVSLIIILIPLPGNQEMFKYPQLWILIIIVIAASMLQPDYKVLLDKTNSQDKGTEIQIIWSVFIIQLFAIVETTYFRFPDSMLWNAYTSISLLLIISGLLLRTWSIYTLGDFFTMHLSVQNKHKVINSGPYKYLRHPSYLGAFMIYIGIPFFLHAWFSSIVAVIILPIIWLRRIYYEEKMLVEKLGEEYLSYCKSVKRIIPGIW